jgi:hypothetical protein
VTSPTGSTNRPGGLRGQVWLDGYGWVQPIRDQRGQVLYYADPVTGARIARKVTGPATGPGSGNTKTATQAKQVNQKHAEATAPSPTTVAAGQQRIWLDGQLVTVQVSPDGLTWTTTPTNGGKAGTEAIPTAFSALDGAELEPTAPFLMGYKTRTGETQTPGPTSRLGGASTRNMLTVGGAAAWLASLSTKDQGAYAAMLEKLRNAGYLSQDDFLAAGGKWSAQAGRAMALAARDTAVVNTTAEGRDTTFTQFIDGKQNVYADSLKAKEEAGKQPYVPTERAYTDPEAIKAAAKSEAESFLGRHLSDAEESELVDHFRGLETAVFDAVDAAGVKGENATFTQPNPTGQIDAFVEGPGREQEGANYRAAQYGQALKRLFGVATGG